MYKIPRSGMRNILFRKFWVSKNLRYLEWESKKKTKNLDEKRGNILYILLLYIFCSEIGTKIISFLYYYNYNYIRHIV